jgi:cell division septation protein DedD
VTKGAPPAVIETAPLPTVAGPTPTVEKGPARAPVEQLASLVKPPEVAPTKPAITRAAPKALEGFIIQLSFSDTDRAQRWAEAMEKKGFAVSVTQAGAEGALRVRLGNFVLRDDAERQLKAIKQEGLNGIILNLPQAFRPEARTSIP